MIEREVGRGERSTALATTHHLSSWQQRNRKLEDKLHRPGQLVGARDLKMEKERFVRSGRVRQSNPSPRKPIKTVNLFCKLRVVKLFHWTIYLSFFTGGKKRHKFASRFNCVFNGLLCLHPSCEKIQTFSLSGRKHYQLVTNQPDRTSDRFSQDRMTGDW